MLVHRSKYLGRDAVLIWWPASAAEVIPYLKQASVVILWQCPESVARELSPWTFYSRGFSTSLVDLSGSEEHLWRQMNQLCRRQLRKAQEIGCVISRNDSGDTARLLINDSIRPVGYRKEFTQAEWRAMVPENDVFLCCWQGNPLVAHVILAHSPKRARLLLSGGADRRDHRFRTLVGPCNRLLHWHELQYYKAQGFRYYDFGGVDLRRNSSEPGPQFKLSFGGEVVEEPMVYLAASPALRTFLRSLSAARSALRMIPWPETWIGAVRVRPRLASLFR